jgi:hypothetical protein
MQESYRKDLASRPGPEPCDTTGNRDDEALVGGHAGHVLSCEIKLFGTPTSLSEAEGNTTGGEMASRRRVPRSRRP